MVSGELAGRALATAGGGRPDAAGRLYERLWRSELYTELNDAVLVQRYLFASHGRVARAIRGAAKLPGLTAAILSYVRGEISYATLRRRMLLRFPVTIFLMARERLASRAERAS